MQEPERVRLGLWSRRIGAGCIRALSNAVGNPQRSREMWDLLLYDKLKSEPNVTLLLDTDQIE